MNAKISMFVNYVEAILYFSLYNLHDCTFKHLWSHMFQSKIDSNMPLVKLIHMIAIVENFIVSATVRPLYSGRPF